MSIRFQRLCNGCDQWSWHDKSRVGFTRHQSKKAGETRPTEGTRLTMPQRSATLLFVVSCLAATCLMAGCASHEMDMEDMAMPQRPAELDQLNAFVGTWVGTAEMTMAGMPEPIKMTSTWTGSWNADKWLLIGNAAFDTGDGNMMNMHEVWAWDAKAKKFRNWWFGSGGEYGHGTSEHEGRMTLWTTRADGKNFMTGKKTRGTGITVFTDPNTMRWEWLERDMWGRMVMQMTGTATRK
jgi:hypothetical protein